MMRWRALVIFQLITVIMVAEGRETAFLEIILYEINQDSGRYTTYKTDITGKFSNAGSSNAAEGDIVQMHPFSLCGDSGDDEKFDYGWVGVVKLSYTAVDPCQSLVEKAKKAVDKGATAVIFDISDHPDASRQLNRVTRKVLNRPVVLVQGDEALELMNIIENKQVARARIQRNLPSAPNKHVFDMGIFMACVILVFILCLIIVAKIKCWRRQRQITFQDLALEALQRMKTRKYKKHWKSESPGQKNSANDTSDKMSMSSCNSMCAICLEDFSEGQELRVIPCQHEFHKRCVDPWLKQKWTCPLCNRNILGDMTSRFRGEQPPQNTENGDAGQSTPPDVTLRTGQQYDEVLSTAAISQISEAPAYYCRSHPRGSGSAENETSLLRWDFNQSSNASPSVDGFNCNKRCSLHRVGSGVTPHTDNVSAVSGESLETGNSTCGSSSFSNTLIGPGGGSVNEMKHHPTFRTKYARLCISETLEEEGQPGGVVHNHGHGTAGCVFPDIGCGNGRRDLIACTSTGPGGADGVKDGVRLMLPVKQCVTYQVQGRTSGQNLYNKMRTHNSVQHRPREHHSVPFWSGYVPDSPETSDCNSCPQEGDACLHESFPCLNLNAATVCRMCRQQLNALHNASTQCVYGSISFDRNCSSFSLSSARDVAQVPERSASALQRPTPEYNDFPNVRQLEAIPNVNSRTEKNRPFTPCIGYSSSDGVEDLGRLSNSSLEGVLEAFDTGSITLSS